MKLKLLIDYTHSPDNKPVDAGYHLMVSSEVVVML